MTTIGTPRICAVLASDAHFFHQARAAIESIRRAIGGETLDVRLIALGPLGRDQLDWLDRARVTRFERSDELPRFHDGPLHSVAMTCRPYLPQIFPDVEGIAWIDADVRFVLPTGLVPWLAQAADPSCTVAAACDNERSYSVTADPTVGDQYHREKYARLHRVHGVETARRFERQIFYNAGVFAMPVVSPVWARYRAHLERAMKLPYDRLYEQDAFNLAVHDAGVRTMPCTLNWLCSMSLPVQGAWGEWTPPDEPSRIIEVLHLTNSDDVTEFENTSLSYYQIYRTLGLPA